MQEIDKGHNYRLKARIANELGAGRFPFFSTVPSLEIHLVQSGPHFYDVSGSQDCFTCNRQAEP